MKFQICKLDLEKAEEPEISLPTSVVAPPHPAAGFSSSQVRASPELAEAVSENEKDRGQRVGLNSTSGHSGCGRLGREGLGRAGRS